MGTFAQQAILEASILLSFNSEMKGFQSCQRFWMDELLIGYFSMEKWSKKWQEEIKANIAQDVLFKQINVFNDKIT